jgi:hypothetical protein
MLSDGSVQGVALDITTISHSPNHALTLAVDINTSTAPGSTIGAFCVDDICVVNYATSAQELDLDAVCVLRHSMASADARAQCDVIPAFGGVCNEHKSTFHLVANAKGGVGVAGRGREMEEKFIGIARGDVDGNGKVSGRVIVAAGAYDE